MRYIIKLQHQLAAPAALFVFVFCFALWILIFRPWSRL